MGEEPSVNAVEMEGMAALWEEPQLVVAGEFTEAYSAVEGVFQTGDGFVEEDGEGVDEGLIHPSVMEMEELLQLALHRCRTDLIWVSGDGPH